MLVEHAWNPVNTVTPSAGRPITAHVALLGGVYREWSPTPGGVAWLWSKEVRK